MDHVQGIHGANCRHSHGPGDGEHNPFEQYDTEENRKEYELQQRQRTLERRIRKTKQEVMGYKTALDKATTEDAKAQLEAKYQQKAALLQKQNKAYKDFCEEHNLKQLSERLKVAKWDRSQAAKARAAAKKYETDFTAQEISDTINKISGATIGNPYGEAAEKHAERYYGLVRSMTTDATKIAEFTGYPIETIQAIKNYIFVDTHDLGDGRIARFYPSFAMAQSWQRLILGNPEPHDLTMLKHEIMELKLVQDGMTQDKAHIAATLEYDYGKESEAYYAEIRERKNRKKPGRG